MSWVQRVFPPFIAMVVAGLPTYLGMSAIGPSAENIAADVTGAEMTHLELLESEWLLSRYAYPPVWAPLPAAECWANDVLEPVAAEIGRGYEALAAGDAAGARAAVSRYFNQFGSTAPSLTDVLNRTRGNADLVLGAIHAYSIRAAAALQSGADSVFWMDLKNPIGAVRLSAGDPRSIEDPDPARRTALGLPGCQIESAQLTTHDLFSNLIAGYLTFDYSDTPDRQAQEFGRGYSEPPDVNPMLALLAGRYDAQFSAIPESRWWALSNSELVVRSTRTRESSGRVLDPWLSHNIVSTIRIFFPFAPEELREHLLGQVRDLAAWTRPWGLGRLTWNEVDRTTVAREFELWRGIGPGRRIAIEGDTLVSGDQQQEIARLVRQSQDLRSNPEEWVLATLKGDVPGVSRDDRRAWRRASRFDLASALEAAGRPDPIPWILGSDVWVFRSESGHPSVFQSGVLPVLGMVSHSGIVKLIVSLALAAFAGTVTYRWTSHLLDFSTSHYQRELKEMA